MHADREVLANHALAHRAYELREFIGESVAHGIRDVENRRAGVNGDSKHFAEVIDLAAGCIFGRELDFIGEATRQTYRLPGHLNDFGAGLLQLVFEVDVGGGDESVNPGTSGSA